MVGPAPARGDERDANPLGALLAVSQLVQSRAPLDDLLAAIARFAGHTLEFSVAAINMYRPVEDVFEITTLWTNDPAYEYMLHAKSSSSFMRRLMAAPHHRDGVYFVLAGSFDWAVEDEPVHVPPAMTSSPGPDDWDPLDLLFAPLVSSTGVVLGSLFVDNPVSGKRPGRDILRALSIVATHAALAIEQSEGDARLREQSLSLTRLVEVAVEMTQTLDAAPTLASVCHVVRSALRFHTVRIYLRDEATGHQLTARAAAGADVNDLQHLDLMAVESTLRSRPSDPGTVELEADAARSLGLGGGWATANPAERGSQAFGDRQIVVPMRGSDDALVGLLVVAAPADRLVPDEVRLQTLRLFGLLAAGTLYSAAQRALQQERDRASHLETHDNLTDLPGRTVLGQEFDARAGVGNDLEAVVLTLQGLDLVTESAGHEVGDQLLRSVAVRLDRVCYPSRLYHLSAHQFALLIGSGEEPPLRLANRVHDAFNRPFSTAGEEYRLWVSAGIAAVRAGESANDVIKRAGIAAAVAESSGSGSKEYDVETDRAGSRFATVAALRGAEHRGEFELHYQPILDARTQQTLSLEALVRWRRDGTLVPPLEFIELAETFGLIEDLGRWVINEAARQSRFWRDSGLAVPPIAVNVSPRQLRQGGLVDTVRSALTQHGLESSALTVEITESAVLPDLSISDQLNALAEIGVHAALDDFGADYSSLSRLRDLPVRTLKVDRAFLSGIPGDTRAEALLGAVIELAGALDLRVVVEGVETPAQAQLLQRIADCSQTPLLLQGFLFSRPLTPIDARAWVEGANRCRSTRADEPSQTIRGQTD